MINGKAEFARRLAVLSGKPFQEAVSTALQTTLFGFQRVPDRTRGDGGLDAASHGLTVGYCCYGLELQSSRAALPASVRKKILSKFKSDLLRILELRKSGKNLKHEPNAEIAKVLGKKSVTKLKAIRLVCNVFDDKELIAELNDAFRDYRAASKNTFVATDCELTIWGPEDVANHTAVSEHLLLQLECPALFDALGEASTAVVVLAAPEEQQFDAKFDALAAKLPPERAAVVQQLRETFRKAWQRSIFLNETLASTTPDLHREFERLRNHAATAARLASGKQGADAFALIEQSQEQLQARLANLRSGALPQADREDLADAETGRLIGECPLEWRSAQ